MLLGLVAGSTVLASVASVAAAGAFLLFPQTVRRTLVPCLISYATGSLLGGAFLGLLPEALELAPSSQVLPAVLGGIVLFFALEKLVIWRHCHEEDCDVHGAAGPLVLIGDGLHNFGDGVVIAAAFVSSIPLGILVSLAVIAHEIPQEVGDFAILLDSGYTRRRAFLLNGLSGLTALIAAVATLYTVRLVESAIPYIMALSAAGFVYIAVADLVPSLHRRTGLGISLRQFFLMLAGMGTIALVVAVR